ncbi:MAG TPA: S8 family serine peptidase, partial [Actinomycetota bacterium]|nr:S8 family serine peptidase [Actinomycetota bacterium]
MLPSPRRATTLVALLALVASLFAPVAAARANVPIPTTGWIGDADRPAVVMTAIDAHRDKIPVEFFDRLKYALPDGTLRVMVALDHRDAAVESFVRQNTVWAQWYGNAPRFLGRVTQDQMVALLNARAITFVEPDYPIKNFMATSTLDVHARSQAGNGTGVWSYDPAGGSMGALRSDVSGLSVDQATGKGVTVAITDSGIDHTHRDFGGWDCEAGPYQPCQSRILKTVTIDHIVETGADPGDSLPTSEAASGHGTHVAGTIAGNAYYGRDGDADPARYGADGLNFGIAPQASLISTKNGDSQSAGLSSFGLQWQLDHAAEYRIKASSNSWGCVGGCSYNPSSVDAQLFKDMFNAGITVVFAAGNDGGGPDGAAFSGDAQSPYVLGVAAYDDTNHQLASFSSRGKDNTLPDPATWTPQSEGTLERRPDVAAPGVNIWSTHSLTGGTAAGPPR